MTDGQYRSEMIALMNEIAELDGWHESMCQHWVSDDGVLGRGKDANGNYSDEVKRLGILHITEMLAMAQRQPLKGVA